MLGKTSSAFESKTATENQFTDLTTLVLAPLQAVAHSNMQLSKNIIENIKSVGHETPILDQKVVFLDNLNLGYQQLKNVDNQQQVLEDMALQIPLLSIMPISSLQIKKANIHFNAEVRGIQDITNGTHYEARVCAPETRDSDNLSKIHFDIELSSSPVAEGLARFIDTINLQQIPKKLNIKAVDAHGNIVSGKQKEILERETSYKEQLQDVEIALSTIENMIAYQKLQFNSALKGNEELSILDYESFMAENIDNHLLINLQNQDPNITNAKEIIDIYQQITSYQHKQQELQQRKNDLNDKLLHLQTKQVLE